MTLLPFTSTAHGANFDQRASEPERAASTSNAVSSRRFRSRRAWDSRAISGSGRSCCELAIENCGSLFVTAEQCKSDRSLKERRKRTGKLVRPFSFRETRFFRKNLTAMRNYGVVGDIPTQNGSELLPAIGRWPNPTNAISDALTLTQHQRKVTTRFSRGACHEI